MLSKNRGWDDYSMCPASLKGLLWRTQDTPSCPIMEGLLVFLLFHGEMRPRSSKALGYFEHFAGMKMSSAVWWTLCSLGQIQDLVSSGCGPKWACGHSMLSKVLSHRSLKCALCSGAFVVYQAMFHLAGSQSFWGWFIFLFKGKYWFLDSISL